MHFQQLKRKLSYSHTAISLCVALIFIIFMNYPDYSVGGGGLYLPFNNTTWIGFSVLLFVSTCIIVKQSKVKVSIFYLLYASAILVLLLPLLYTDTRYLDYEVMMVWAILAAYLLLVIVSQFTGIKFKRGILFIILVSSIIQTFWGLIQYYFIFDANILFLVAEYDAPVGVFNQKNVFSIYLNVGSLIALYFYFLANKKSNLGLISLLILLVLNAHLNVLAGSLTGRVVSLIAIGIYLSYFAYQTRMFTLPSLLFVAVILTIFTPKHWFDVRASGEISTAEIQSLGTRPVMYQLGAELALKQPVSGTGIGLLRYDFAHQLAIKQSQFEGYNSIGQIKHIHNEPLQWMLELGFVSGLAFVIIFLTWVWGIWKKAIDTKILLLSLPLVGQSMLEFPFHTSAPHFLIFAILLGLSIKKPKRIVKLPMSVSYASLVVVSYVCVMAVLHMLQSLASSKAVTEYERAEVKNIELLEKVTPTLTYSLYTKMLIFEHKLQKGFATGEINVDDVYDFIEWAEYIKEYYPVNKIYIRLGQAYLISQNMEAAKRIIDEADILFPDEPKVVDMVERMRVFMESSQ